METRAPREFRGHALPHGKIKKIEASKMPFPAFLDHSKVSKCKIVLDNLVDFKHILKAEPYWSLFLIMVFACKGK